MSSRRLRPPDEDDCIHPSINTLGARTSRMSMERPNLQNLPRKNERNTAAEAIRSCVTARDGNVMLMCDFDQVEMRMMAHMAQEHTMIDAFRGDTDFFVALARMVYGDDSIVKSDPRRQVVKNAGYATIYGAGVEKFSKTAGAAVLKMKLIELDSAGLGEWMVVPVHDEIILDVPAEHFEDAADTLRRVMNDDQMFSVPLSASVSYGMSWGSKESYDHRS
jgi:DNA polymerase I-like protein with 3'-5' exonuclease and polymerase domains